MNNLSLKEKTIIGTFWGAIERFSGQGIQFVVLIVMARLLTPKDYGLIGMVTVFTSIAQTLIDSGFSQALIRKRRRTEIDNSTTLYFNIAVGFFVYVVFYLIAPYVASFYNEPELKSVMRVISIIVVLNSFSVVQVALYTARVDFKTQSKATFFSATISGVVGIYSAYVGYNVWSLVYQQLSYAFVNMLLLWWFSNWYPKFVFSWQSFRELFAFGSKILVSGLLNTIYNNMYQLVIGKVFNASTLGFYSRASHFAIFPSTNISGILQRVSYPILCELQDDTNKLIDVYRKFIRISTLIIFPLMMILAAVSRPMIVIVLGEKWIYAATLLCIICFSSMWYPIHHLNVNILQAIGRSDLTLKTEVMKKCVGVIILVVTIPFGIETMCYGGILSSMICLVINCYYVGKLLNVGFVCQMKDVMAVFLISIAIFVFILLLSFVVENDMALIILGCLIGVLLFVVLCVIFNIQAYQDLRSLWSAIKH